MLTHFLFQDHDARYKPHATSLARSALARLSPDPVAALDTLASNLKTPLEPLHPTHWLLTSYTRDLIESGMLELLPDETVAARAYLVSADRFVMKRTGMLFDLGYLHDLEGLEKAIEAAQRVGANKVWDGLAEWAKDKAEKQKRVLC